MKKKAWKGAALLLTLALTLTLCACGKKQEPVSAEKVLDAKLTMVSCGEATVTGSASYNSGVFREGKTVMIPDFLLSETEITQALYTELMEGNEYDLNASPFRFCGDDFPAENVSWYDAAYFCNLLSEASGFEPAYKIVRVEAPNGHIINARVTLLPGADGYRLPTEAEWEFAARSGKAMDAYRFAGSDTAKDVAWTAETSAWGTHSVGTLKANRIGLFDMSGNVWEWTDGIYESARGPENAYRVIRGGSWWNAVDAASVTNIFIWDGSEFDAAIGFRVARTLGPAAPVSEEGNGLLGYYRDGYDFRMSTVDEDGNVNAIYVAEDGVHAIAFKAKLTEEEKGKYDAIDFWEPDGAYKRVLLLNSLSGAVITDISDLVPADEGLEAYVGKTIAYLEADGYKEQYHNLWDNELEGCYTDGKISVFVGATNPEKPQDGSYVISEDEIGTLVIETIHFNDFVFGLFE